MPKHSRLSARTALGAALLSVAVIAPTVAAGPVHASTTGVARVLAVHAAKPRVTMAPSATKVKVGQTATFKIKASGSGLKYQWYVKTAGATSYKKVAKATRSSLSVTKAKASAHGNRYRVVVTNRAGRVTSASAKLSVSKWVKPVLATATWARVEHKKGATVVVRGKNFADAKVTLTQTRSEFRQPENSLKLIARTNTSLTFQVTRSTVWTSENFGLPFDYYKVKISNPAGYAKTGVWQFLRRSEAAHQKTVDRAEKTWGDGSYYTDTYLRPKMQFALSVLKSGNPERWGIVDGLASDVVTLGWEHQELRHCAAGNDDSPSRRQEQCRELVKEIGYVDFTDAWKKLNTALTK